ncbi:MAG TPA: SBBP repeat-containing protein, partial [Anaerolineae bacterium]|nr:SBBP repeat-containing protein [Anaerolineae bacterium]
SDKAYVTGGTSSSNFPTTPGAFDTSLNGNGDAFVVKLNATGTGLNYATFLGGGGGDSGNGIAVDGTGRAYVTGLTYSSDFPTPPGAFDPSFNGAYDAFVARLNAAGSGLDCGTFLGGGGNDWGNGIAVDGMGRAYVTGFAASSDFPTTPGAFDPTYAGGTCGLPGSPYPCSDAFVAKLNAAGSGLDYATFLGGSNEDAGADIAVDAMGRAYVTGGTRSSDFPTTPGAFDPTFGGGVCGPNLPCSDAFVTRLNATGSGLDYATFLGGSVSGDDSGKAIAVDSGGNAYVAGGTNSTDFPATPDAFDASHNGSGDAFVAKLDIEPYTPNVVAPIEQPPAGVFVSGAVTLRGFAVDRGSAAGTGIDAVHIYLDGPYGVGTIIGAATYGLDRPDIAAQYGARFGPSGWELAWDTTGLAPGVHRLNLYAHRTADNAWSVMDPHLVIVAGGPTRWLPIVLRRQ